MTSSSRAEFLEKKKYPILSDPRICKGSIVAKKREEKKKIENELKLRNAEEKYRMEVVRNRLNIALGVNGIPGGPCNNRFNKLSSIKAETNERLAKLANKTGKISIIEWRENFENGIEKKSPRKQKPPRRLSPIKKEFSKIQDSDMFGRETKKESLKNVRFVPLKEAINGVSSGPHKIVPSIPKKDEFFRKKRFNQVRRFNPSPFTPPHTPYGIRHFNDASVQTDEAFDEAFNPIVSEMAETAIQEALRNLKDEEDFKFIEEQNEKLLEIVVTQKRRNSELNLSILKHIRTEHELGREKEIAYRKLTALDCHRMAVEFIDELIDKCSENLANRGMIDDISKYKSVGADTRQLEKHQQELQEITLEIEQDFFPYVYAKAEQIFVHKLADSYLRDALFSKDLKHKAEARSKLNEQIQKYQELTKGIRLSTYSKKFGLN